MGFNSGLKGSLPIKKLNYQPILSQCGRCCSVEDTAYKVHTVRCYGTAMAYFTLAYVCPMILTVVKDICQPTDTKLHAGDVKLHRQLAPSCLSTIKGFLFYSSVTQTGVTAIIKADND